MSDGPLDEIAARFVLPAKSGVYVTKNERIALARASDGSLRINERKRMLADVLKSPQNPAELKALFARLIGLCELHLRDWDGLIASFPLAARSAAPWQEKARATITWLEELTEELTLAERA